MTPQERESLIEFLRPVVQAQGLVKDADADALIRDAFSRQPDAPYLLVLKAMLLDKALEDARAQISQLQSRSSAPQSSSFLGGDPWGTGGTTSSPPPPPPYQNTYSGQSYSRPPAFSSAPQPPYYQPQARAGGGMSSFFGTAASVAAGVAGGALLFQGVESLFDHHGGAGGLLGDNAQMPPEETLVNNYYGNDGDNQQAADSDPEPSAMPADYSYDDPGNNDDGSGWI